MSIYLKLLGYFELRHDGGAPLSLPTRKAQALLAYLAAHAGRPSSRDTLTALLWPDRGEKQARHSLTQTLYTLRKVLDQPNADAFLTDGGTIALNAAAVESDVAAFAALAGDTDPKARARAAELYNGDLLEGLVLREEPFMEWLSLEQARLRERGISVLTGLLDSLIEAGRHEEAVLAAHRLLAIDPLQENVHRALMKLHADQGRATSALRQYRLCEETLRRDLGVEPDTETRALLETIKARQDGPAAVDPEPVAAEKQSDGWRASDREYKQASVLAAFLSAPPEPASFAVIEETVQRFGGTVQHRGRREFMAVFGAPVAQEDHAERACRAALALAELPSQCDGLRLRIDSGGVMWRANGAARGGIGGISGAPVLRALEMAQDGAWPSPVASGETFALARRRIAFRRVDGDGAGPSTPLYSIVGSRDDEDAAGRWANASAFFGRDGELSALSGALEAVGKGHGRAVAMIGEPGVGKSRLLHEFLTSGIPSGWRTLRCAGVSHGRDIPYLPLRRLMRSFFDLPALADRDAVREIARNGVMNLDRSLEAMLPALLSLFEIEEPESDWNGLEPVQKRRRIMDAVKAVLHRESRNQPLVIAIEDLHWLDAETERVLNNLMDGLPASRQLLLVNYRPEYRPDWAGRSWVGQLTIGPLSGDSAATMLDWMLGTAPSLARLKQHLIGHTGGNPFFMEESVHVLADRAMITGARGRYELHGDPASVIVPETVQAVIADRMDRLDALAKHVLQTAAVIGYEAPHALLERVCGVGEEPLHESLDRLKDGEFLVETRPPPDAVYAFKHALTHGAAYEAILPENRRTLHGQILRTLENAYDDRREERIEALARHASLGEIWDKAADYCKEAGLRAAARSANGAAVAYYELALAALDHLPARDDLIEKEIDLHFDVRNALFILGDHEAIPGHLEKAEELARKIGDLRRVGWAKLHLGGYGWQSGQYDTGLEACRAAMDIAERCGDEALGTMARYRTGLAYHGMGRFPEAVTCFENCIAALDRADDATAFALGGIPYVFCLSFLAWSHAELGQFEAANLHGERGWQMAAESNHTYTQAVMAFGWGHALLAQGRTDEAAELLEKGIELFEINEAHATFPWNSAPLGYVRVVQGDRDMGLALLRRAVAPAARRCGVQYANPFLWLAEALLRVGRTDEARETARNARSISDAQGEGCNLAWAERLLGDIAASDDAAAARVLYESALARAVTLELRPRAEQCRLGLARLEAGAP